MAINSFDIEWNGHTGQEVEEFIKNKIQANLASIADLQNTGVTKITADFKEGDKTTIVIKGYNSKDKVVTTSEFKTVTESAYEQHFNSQDKSYEPKQIIKVNTDYLIPYDYYITNEKGDRVKGHSATVNFTIICNNERKVFTTSTYSSTTSALLKEGTFIIPKEYLGVGVNEIQMQAVTYITSSSVTSRYEAKYKLYVADLKLQVGLSGESFYTPRAYDKNFTLNFNVVDSLGKVIPTKLNESDAENTIVVKKRIYVDRIGPSYLCTKANELTSSQITTNYNTIVRNTTIHDGAEVNLMPSIRLLIQAYIVDSDGQEIISNTILMDMLNSTGIDNDSTGSVFIATQLDDVIMDMSKITTKSIQYDLVKYNFYLYSKVENSYNITISGETKTSGNIAANTLTSVEYNYIYRTPGEIEVGLNDFNLTNNVIELETALHEPSGETLSLLANEKAAGTKDPEWGGVTTFNGFDWISNGWVNTSEGTALLLNNGASIDVNYKLCDRDEYNHDNYPFTISFKYKIVNGTNESEELIKCLASNTGILIKPQYVGMKVSATIDQNISNDEVHEVTFVYYGTDESSGIYKKLQAIYIDGKYQAIGNAGVFVPHKGKIEIKATDASLYLYSIKAFRKALSFTEIQSLYCFNQHDSNKIPGYIKENNIFNVSTTSIGDYSQNIKMEHVPDGAGIYVLYSDVEDPTPWLTINSYIKDADEVNKGRIHALKAMRFYIKGDPANPRNFYTVGGSMSAQGTSSMDYSLKNYRFYFNKNAKKSGIAAYDNTVGKVTAMYQGTKENPLPYNFDPQGDWSDAQRQNFLKSKAEYQIFSTEYDDPYTSAPSNRFCFKADYAESSGVHNTGFARLSNEILTKSAPLRSTNITSSEEYSELPQQHAITLAGDKAKWKYDVRFNIDGRPVYLFFVTPDGTEYYAGRYNMNNDKSNVQVFGFEKVTDYFENDIVKQEGKYLQQKAIEEGIDLAYAQTHNANPDDTFINPIECWEFSSNDGIPREIGSFYYDANTAFQITSNDPDPEDKEYRSLYWLNGTWEYRYPDLDGGSDGDLAYRRGQSKPYLLYKTYQFLYKNNYAKNPTISTLNGFADGLHYYFNVNSIVKYFILTHMVVAADQRVKNCMLAFYCDPWGVSAEEAIESPLHYMRGYYIFYDNDTILGLNNAGAIRQPWDFYETDTGNESKYASDYTPFPGNGIHGIWNNLQKCYELYVNGTNINSSAYKLGRLIADAYKNIRNIATNDLIESYLETAQCNYYPAAIQNVDLEAKYLNPNNLRTPDAAENIPVHLDMAHGTREFHRKNWLNKRLLWLDDIYNATQADGYKLSYKTAVTQGNDNGTIKLTSDPTFRSWRFYGWTGGKSFTKATKQLLHTEIGEITVPSNTLSNSDTFNISDLYGCKSIDFSEYNFDDSGVQQCAVDGKFPYLQTFTLHTESGSQIKSTPEASILNWISLSAMPNLRNLTFCNVVPTNGDYFATLKLYDEGLEFSKLENLDLRKTPISEVILPNSSTLKTIKLASPVTLSLINKPNITSLEIPTNELSKLIVSKCSPVVYSWALNTVINNYGVNEKEFNITFGDGVDNPYIIDSSNSNQLNQLDSIAKLLLQHPEYTTRISITGNIYTSEQFETDDIEQAFPGLNITNSLITEGFNLEWTNDLYEDSTSYNGDDSTCFVIKANMNVANWRIAVDGSFDNNLNDLISIVKTSKQRCWVHANPFGQNAKVGGVDHKLTVYATLSDGTEYNSYDLTGNEINIYYNPISTLTLTTDKEYVSGEATTITFNFGNHTKKHLLTSANIDQFKINTTNANYSLIYDTDTSILSGMLLQLTSTEDSIASVDIWGASSKIKIYYDSTLVTISEAQNTDKHWISLLANACSQQFVIGATITKSMAAKIPIQDSHQYWNTVITGLQDISVPQDFTYLKYFQLGNMTDGIFTIPSIPFTNLETPVGTTGVSWTSPSDNLNAYETITFGEKVKKAVISLALNSIPDKLKFDLSKTNISKIYNAGQTFSSIENDTLSLQITALSPISAMRSESLFVYPPTITQIGNIDESIDLIMNHDLMFNIQNSGEKVGFTTATLYYPLFFLGGFTSNITLGAITSYGTKGSAISDWSKVTSTTQSFIYNNNAMIVEGVFSLPNVINVGNESFYRDFQFKSNVDRDLNELRINGNVKEIGNSAFLRGSYVIKNANNLNSEISEFNEVTKIGANAFQLMTKNQNLRFGSKLESVGSGAFISQNNSINVYINRTQALTFVQPDSFGESGNNVTIYVPANSELYTQLTASGMACKNRVMTF